MRASARRYMRSDTFFRYPLARVFLFFFFFSYRRLRRYFSCIHAGVLYAGRLRMFINGTGDPLSLSRAGILRGDTGALEIIRRESLFRAGIRRTN